MIIVLAGEINRHLSEIESYGTRAGLKHSALSGVFHVWLEILRLSWSFGQRVGKFSTEEEYLGGIVNPHDDHYQ